jgi:hypothetical protein
MPSSRERLSLYSPELINAMTQAFTAVWTTLYSHLPMDGDGADELKIALSRTIVALVSEGVRDPKELRRRALENMALRSSS